MIRERAEYFCRIVHVVSAAYPVWRGECQLIGSLLGEKMAEMGWGDGERRGGARPVGSGEGRRETHLLML